MSKVVVRYKVWETNSSSQHVIAITKNESHINPEEMIWDRNKENQSYDTVYLSHGEWNLRDIDEGYGRYPFEILVTFEDKFKYAMCEFLGSLYPDDPEYKRIYKEFEEIARECLPGFQAFRIDVKYYDIYKDQNGNNILRKDIHYDYYDRETEQSHYYYVDADGKEHPAILNEDFVEEAPDIGQIDHQSAGLLKNFLKNEGISLKKFLTNRKYNVVIDGDEYQKFQQLREAGFFENVIRTYGTSSEDLEYQEWLREQEENGNEINNTE